MKKKDHKTNDKIRPDQGQGSAGSFGADGDWGTEQDKSKKEERKNSPVTIKKAK